ncbi:MAG TPA: esterase-like activity of phytase family protein, partial [Dyadobacter sp.]|nr:esterase-like activity of phytase family protein [Dyadobacter sp.]
MKYNLLLGATALMAAAVISCTDHEISGGYPEKAEASNPAILTDANGVKVYNGGFGSALVQDPKDKKVFY